MNPRSTVCEADALTTTPARRYFHSIKQEICEYHNLFEITKIFVFNRNILFCLQSSKLKRYFNDITIEKDASSNFSCLSDSNKKDINRKLHKARVAKLQLFRSLTRALLTHNVFVYSHVD